MQCYHQEYAYEDHVLNDLDNLLIVTLGSRHPVGDLLGDTNTGMTQDPYLIKLVLPKNSDKNICRKFIL